MTGQSSSTKKIYRKRTKANLCSKYHQEKKNKTTGHKYYKAGAAKGGSHTLCSSVDGDFEEWKKQYDQR